MILSASRRTDIPCRYSEWFMNRIREGFVLVRNPMNHAQISRIALSPDVVDCIVFWTKDAANIIPHLDELDRRGFRCYFQFTLTPYDHSIEPGLRAKPEIEDTFIALSERIGRERVVWRYDPIILNEHIGTEYHRSNFRRMCAKLAPYTDTVTISFVDLYTKLKTPLLRALTREEIAELAGMIGSAANEFGLRAVACCEQDDLTQYGIGRSSCIDQARIEKICGCPLDLRDDKNQRSGCGCCESIDVGTYNSCPNGCVYCYANRSADAARKAFAAHDPSSALLNDAVYPGERITERSVRSNLQNQINLF